MKNKFNPVSERDQKRIEEISKKEFNLSEHEGWMRTRDNKIYPAEKVKEFIKIILEEDLTITHEEIKTDDVQDLELICKVLRIISKKIKKRAGDKLIKCKT